MPPDGRAVRTANNLERFEHTEHAGHYLPFFLDLDVIPQPTSLVVNGRSPLWNYRVSLRKWIPPSRYNSR